MGWKSSLIIIENKENFNDENAILQAIGKSDYKFEKETSLEECIYPNDHSINIGYYNGNIIISDDYQITTSSLEKAKNLDLTKEEKNLVELFPNSEIVTVACHSVVNYHGYSIIKNGIKERLKVISSDTPKIDLGKRVEEEEKIYEKSYLKDNKHYWKNEYDDDGDFTEDQLMEDFTFGIAKRRLGVFLDQSDGEELMEKVKFRKYIKPDKKSKWIRFGRIILIIIILRILRRVFFD